MTAKFSTEINSPEVTRCSNFLQSIITFPYVRTWPSDPMITTNDECWVYRQFLLPFMSLFSNTIRALFLAPFYAPASKDWVVSFKFLKWTTGIGKNVGITAKKSDYSSTRGVNGCFDVKSSSMLLFTAVESQLMEKQDCFHFSHTVRWKNQLGVVVTTDTIVWLLNIQTDRGRRLIYYNVIYQKPTSYQ